MLTIIFVSFCMLCIAAMRAVRRRYCTSFAQADYYQEELESPGCWCGRTVSSLGISGSVTAENLQALFNGHAPNHGTTLVQNAGRMVPTQSSDEADTTS